VDLEQVLMEIVLLKIVIQQVKLHFLVEESVPKMLVIEVYVVLIIVIQEV